MRFSLFLLPLVGALRPKMDVVEPTIKDVVEHKVPGAKGSDDDPVAEKKMKHTVIEKNLPQDNLLAHFKQEPAAKTDAATTGTETTMTTAPPTPTGIWHLGFPTTVHAKQAGNGYKYGSPLYGQNMETIVGKKNQVSVSTAMSCIMVLCCQFFLILAGVAVLKTYRELSGATQPSKALIALQVSRSTLGFVPMLCVMFLAIRMRAVQLSQGETEKYELPAKWVQNSMWASTYAVLIQACMVLLTPFFGRMPEVDADGNMIVRENPQAVAMAQPPSSGMSTKVMLGCRTVCLLALWGGVSCCAAGIWTMEPPAPIWGPRSEMTHDGYPWPAPAIAVTMDLTFLFFIVYGAMAILKELNNPKFVKWIELLGLCSSSVALIPMFCVLFIGARMRALQMDPLNGKPQSWAQNAMFVTAGAMWTQIVSILVVGGFLNAEVREGNCEGDVRFRSNSTVLLTVMNIIRWVCVIGIYAGSITVLVSILTIEHPTDPALTPPVSPAMKCVSILTVLYLFVYFGIFLVTSMRQFAPNNPQFLAGGLSAFDAARGCVFFAPMLSILFVGVRMRALQLSDNKGSPPGYAQDWMFMAAWSVTVQTFLCLALGAQTDEDGNVVAGKGGSKAVRIALEGLRYLCMIAMYGAGVGLSYAMYDMTAVSTLEKAGDRSSIFPWGNVPEPVNPGEVVASTASKDAAATFF